MHKRFEHRKVLERKLGFSINGTKKKMEQENDRLVAAQREVYEEVGLVNQEARFANMVS